MACACKVNQQLSYMQKMYGNRQLNSSEPKTHIVQDIKVFFHKLGLMLLLIPLMPLMFIFLVGRSIFRKTPLKIDDLFFRNKKN